jgi:hypothetical protein
LSFAKEASWGGDRKIKETIMQRTDIHGLKSVDVHYAF